MQSIFLVRSTRINRDLMLICALLESKAREPIGITLETFYDVRKAKKAAALYLNALNKK